MGYQEVDEIVEQGFQPLSEGGTKEQRRMHKENKKKDCKAMFLLHQCVDEAHFEKISGAENSKEAWLILEACNQGVKQLKKVQLQTLRRQYELMHMESNERVAQFFNKVITYTNAMKACGEKISDQSIIEKILRTLTPRFDHIVVEIEESKKIEEMKVQDLQGSLEAHEQRLIERSNGRPVDQALQAQFTDKRSLNERNGFRSRGARREFRGGNHKNFQQRDHDKTGHGTQDSERRGTLSQWRGGRRSVDIKKLRISLGSNNDGGKSHTEAHMVKEETTTEIEEQPLLLMMITNQVNKNSDVWYIDSECLSHMTGYREWLVNFDERKKNNVRFPDNRMIQAEGTGDVLINRKDGKHAMITDVLYVPNMKSNLISMGQLLERGFSMGLIYGSLEVYDHKK
ncbi:PREDICTED: uncharacterized protein LOC109356227 [Lupinus angustifolius]|uniref:uncharacterized protein LOC109356227 n=1 Tax=Lupinus angustifolius TaxID=3871 RepID=UPI00092F7368|nr:PREDICTED: uncharacterized protein LOC109356227 [Lupinus angustifolius]